jgi:hypothetical protein
LVANGPLQLDEPAGFRRPGPQIQAQSAPVRTRQLNDILFNNPEATTKVISLDMNKQDVEYNFINNNNNFNRINMIVASNDNQKMANKKGELAVKSQPISTTSTKSSKLF